MQSSAPSRHAAGLLRQAYNAKLQLSCPIVQARAEALALEGNNLFFTGNAGTGKSFLLKRIIAKLKRKHPGAVSVTAATGIAATHIAGAQAKCCCG